LDVVDLTLDDDDDQLEEDNVDSNNMKTTALSKPARYLDGASESTPRQTKRTKAIHTAGVAKLDKHVEPIVTQNESEWRAIVAKSGIQFFRIRCFQKDSRVADDDPNGRKCAQWCIQNGYIASSSRIIHPDHLNPNADAKNYLAFHDKYELKEKADGILSGCDGINVNYPTLYKMFGVDANQGDVVALMVPSAQKRDTRQRETYFGVITSDELEVLKPQEAIDRGFPAPHLFYSLKAFRNGIMIRHVKWMRKCKTCELLLPGVDNGGQVKALLENVPKWFQHLQDTDHFVNDVNNFLARKEPV
jgi:hypothetical protein